ncbi:pantoate--beta-alanine ligase [Clostridium sp. SYSU_GA19001]|uniref:pantoate--beta-alanine ligase n=1 Tax=Clostridium caldaquaticum TaxID=2940653 RepID=UPI002076FAB2|nr:pantoate--beta-alanine ligase [Clostridium caldaquaticum]MCM8710269.1 pantoate--beta-alanine ligase [Clostridium caldaquaticum]
MNIIYNIKDLRAEIKKWRNQGFSIGFVPTMGYLHEGHGSLIKKAREENDKVVVSIFVNPIQFGPNEDFEKYPRDMERDSKMVKQYGGHLIFNPSHEEMYPVNFSSYVDVDGLTEGLCGSKRPGHFKGVCTVVTKLFNIVQPDKAYFGEKDAQQLAVIKRMVRDLDMPVEVIACPIIRENDGLAKSSRNTYLNPEERKAALILSKSLQEAKAALNNGERDALKIKEIIINKLTSEPMAKIDYVEIVDSLSLKPVSNINTDILVAIAVFIGKTRLIDNFTFTV